MAITRDRLGSNAKSSASNLRAKNNFISSEDDLFEKSASQSASRQTRTINHIVPKEVSKKLSHDFEAVSGLDKENQKTSNSATGKRTVIQQSRPLVKRTVSKASHTSSHSPHLTQSTSHSSSVTKIPLSFRREIVLDFETGVDDPIFDVPVTSPPAPRVNLDLNEMRKNLTTTTTTNTTVMISTPSKHSKLTNAALTSLNVKSPSVALMAEVRKTPLTMAEKKRRQSMIGSVLDKTTKTNISALKLVKRDKDVKEVEVKSQEVRAQEVIEIIESSPKKTKSVDIFDPAAVTVVKKAKVVTIEESKESEKKKIFIRNQTTESAPPDIITKEEEKTEDIIVNEKETCNTVDTNVINSSYVKNNNSSYVINDNSSYVNNNSLIIKVPPPPKLEDLETLDPELYVKLKSGSLKDDPSVPFISETDRIDIESFLESFASPELAKNLLPVAIIGEGTFSTVYKVIDKSFYECENSGWTEYSRQNPLDWLRLWRWVYNQEPMEKFVLFRDGKRCVDRNGRSLGGVVRTMTTTAAGTKKSSSGSSGGKLAVLLRRYLLEWAVRSLDSLLPVAGEEPGEAVLGSITPRALQSAMLRFRPFFIALKRINATSSPQRILDEMSFLKHLGGKNNVVPLINGLRCEDQVLVTFPYFYSDDFREFLGMQNFSINSIACYMRSLFISLAHLHAHNIIHRDVKPSNFLYAPENGGRAVLLDFGLAQKAATNYNSGTGRNNQRHAHVLTSSIQQQQQLQQQRINTSRNTEKERKKLQAVNLILNSIGGTVGADAGESCEKLLQLTGQLGPGYFNNDPRAAMKASRAGTRGFRAPEVLFKFSNQTTALDIWSAGVILLTLLTRRYPFFHSSDDYDAIVEIANIFGNEEMAGAAKLYGRKWTCNVPSVPAKHVTWPTLCEKLNPSVVSEIPEECYDLLRECLNLNSEKRITAKNALKHPFIIKYAK